jgi:hypothetical protein
MCIIRLTKVPWYPSSSDDEACDAEVDECAIACLIKPKSQMGISYPPYLVHILILLGFAKRIKFLAVPEIRPNLTSILAENTKVFQNL